jgi:hypothetical protein
MTLAIELDEIDMRSARAAPFRKDPLFASETRIIGGMNVIVAKDWSRIGFSQSVDVVGPSVGG